MTKVALFETINVMNQSGRPISVGPKGRVVLPVAVRRAAGIEEGQDLVAHADGEGRIVLETVAALNARIWAAIPASTGDAEAERVSRHDVELALEEAGRSCRDAFSLDDYEAVSAALVAYLES